MYTGFQLFEVTLFASVLLFGVLAQHGTEVIVGGGLLIGKAVLNILAPEGGSVYRRSLIGYGVGFLFIAVAVLLQRLLG